MKVEPGELVDIEVDAGGIVTHDSGTVLITNHDGIWLDNGPGNRPSGPYNAITGIWMGHSPFGVQRIIKRVSRRGLAGRMGAGGGQMKAGKT